MVKAVGQAAIERTQNETANMVHHIGNDLLSHIISVEVESNPDRIPCLARVSKQFSLSCHNPLLWKSMLQKSWRWELLSADSIPSPVDWRRAFIDIEDGTRNRIADWHNQFNAHSTEPQKWQQPIEAFLSKLLSNSDTTITIQQPGSGRQQAREQLGGEQLAVTKRSAAASAPAAKFLFEIEMDRSMRGEFLGSCSGMGLPMAVIGLLPLHDVGVVGGLRLLLEKVCTRTSYSLNRIMRALGAQLYEMNSQLGSEEAANSLVYAAMMLNTDMYSKNVKAHHRMSKPIFIEKVLEMLEDNPVEPAVIQEIYDSMASGGPLRVGEDSKPVTEPSQPPVGTQFLALAEGCSIM